MVVVAVFAAWKPRSVYDNIRAEHGTTSHPLNDVKRLARHWPIYPALLICALWNFAPGAATHFQSFPSEHIARFGRPVGPVECHLCCLLCSDLHGVRASLPKSPPESPARVGNRCRSSADGPVALHSFGDGSFNSGSADGTYGGCRHRRLFGSNHSVLPPGFAGHNAHDVRQPFFHSLAIWRCFGDEPL